MVKTIKSFFASVDQIVIRLDQVIVLLKSLERIGNKLVANTQDVINSQATLHQDLQAENGVIKQLLTAFANGNLTPVQAQALVNSLTADDADAKANLKSIQDALTPPIA